MGAYHPPPPPPPPPPPEEPPPPPPEEEPGEDDEDDAEETALVKELPRLEVNPDTPMVRHEEPEYHRGVLPVSGA